MKHYGYKLVSYNYQGSVKGLRYDFEYRLERGDKTAAYIYPLENNTFHIKWNDKVTLSKLKALSSYMLKERWRPLNDSYTAQVWYYGLISNENGDKFAPFIPEETLEYFDTGKQKLRIKLASFKVDKRMTDLKNTTDLYYPKFINGDVHFTDFSDEWKEKRNDWSKEKDWLVIHNLEKVNGELYTGGEVLMKFPNLKKVSRLVYYFKDFLRKETVFPNLECVIDEDANAFLFEKVCEFKQKENTFFKGIYLIDGKHLEFQVSSQDSENKKAALSLFSEEIAKKIGSVFIVQEDTKEELLNIC